MHRGNRTSWAGVHWGSSLDNCAKITSKKKVLAQNNFVTVGVPDSLNRVVNSGMSARLHTGRFEGQPSKNIEKGW